MIINKYFLYLIITICFFLLTHVFECQHLNVPVDQDRISKGKEELDKIHRKSSHSVCWRDSLFKLEVSCQQMNDIEQSILALDFANCHLEKSGLETYHCNSDNFKSCTQKMSLNIIAFQTYTEFFTHVSDICFYLQSDLWREKTEETISKLSESSKESLDVLSKSIDKQQQVLLSQQQSLQNQKDILINENLLKETLLTSAESAKDVFKEVREHAQQQKTMFSETFDNIFESVERLSNLQKMLLGEFIGLQSIGFYFVAIIVCYLFTSTPRTSMARLPLFIGLTILIIVERLYVEWRVSKSKDEFTTEQLHEHIWSLRKSFLLLALIGLAICIAKYKDFNKINFSILQDIQVQILELRKIQETHTGSGPLDITDCCDATIKPDMTKLNEATRQLEMSLQAIVSSTPSKNHDYMFSTMQNHQNNNILPPMLTKKKKQLMCNKGEFSDCDEIEMKQKQKRKRISRRTNENIGCSIINSSGDCNESRYNLRSRRSSNSFSASLMNNSLAPSSLLK